jgi:hypothetical protein
LFDFYLNFQRFNIWLFPLILSYFLYSMQMWMHSFIDTIDLSDEAQKYLSFLILKGGDKFKKSYHWKKLENIFYFFDWFYNQLILWVSKVYLLTDNNFIINQVTWSIIWFQTMVGWLWFIFNNTILPGQKRRTLVFQCDFFQQ